MRILVTAMAFTLLLTACNTVRGVGRDLESVGDAVERTAD